MSWLYRFLLAVVLTTIGLESAESAMATLRPPRTKNALLALLAPPETVVPPLPPPPPPPVDPLGAMP